ncbi:MAG: hypothetical protein H0T42_21020 [Deltaproteobacteria bacterium]|nr:hypothetical protein [Deltaproteobacteria bacterium]
MLPRLLVLVPLFGCATEAGDSIIPSSATGELAIWQSVAPLPVARANHCSAAVGDWLLVIGGNHKEGSGFVKTAEIHAARVSADGTVGAWQLAGMAPSPLTECSATSDGTTLYVIDGIYDDETDARQVWSATLDSTGHLAPLTSLGTLPEAVISSEATVRNGELVVMDTRLPADGETTVTLRAKPTSPLVWQVDDWQIGFRGQAQYALGEDFTFVLGGYRGDTGNPVTAETFVAPAAFATPRMTRALPTPTTFGEAVAVDDWIFVAGGRDQVFGASGTTTVVAAHHDAEGSLGEWSTVSALPMARTNHELVVVGDFLVLTGGAGEGPGDTTVLTARVRYPSAD